VIQCPECHTWFEVIFNRNPVYDRMYYCPFCAYEFTDEDVENWQEENDE
jgi:hypothetical protein